MSKAVVVAALGGPEQLEFKEWPVGAPGPGQLHIRQRAIGVNFVDVYQRTGLYPVAPPFVAGMCSRKQACGSGHCVGGVAFGVI